MADLGNFIQPYKGSTSVNAIPFFPETNPTTKRVKFVGGYVIDLTKAGIPSIVQVKKLNGNDGDDEKGWPYTNKSKFYVKLDLSGGESGGIVKGAEIASIPDGDGEKLPATDKIFLACEFEGTSERPIISKIVLRQNIVWQIDSVIAPWTPIITLANGSYSASITLGSVNGVVPQNYTTKFSITKDTKYYPTLTITSSLGQVKTVVISMPTSNQVTQDYVSKDTPPTTFKILLGVFDTTTRQMIFTENISLNASEVYKASKDSPKIGTEPYSRYYRWNSY